jgi:hypothetical protein
MISISSQIRRALIDLDRGRGDTFFFRLVTYRIWAAVGHRQQHRTLQIV